MPINASYAVFGIYHINHNNTIKIEPPGAGKTISTGKASDIDPGWSEFTDPLKQMLSVYYYIRFGCWFF